jgi:hypothetical protein
VAGIAASILLASCSSTAAQYLSLLDGRSELAGAAAVRGATAAKQTPTVNLSCAMCAGVCCWLGYVLPIVSLEQQLAGAATVGRIKDSEISNAVRV